MRGTQRNLNNRTVGMALRFGHSFPERAAETYTWIHHATGSSACFEEFSVDGVVGLWYGSYDISQKAPVALSLHMQPQSLTPEAFAPSTSGLSRPKTFHYLTPHGIPTGSTTDKKSIRV